VKTGTALKRGLTRIARLWEAARYDEALAAVEALLGLSPDSPPLLVMRARLAQLVDDGGPSLDDAEADLKLAAKLDPQSPVALIELGYLTYALKDDARGASPLFDEAVRRAKALLREALIGQVKALAEAGRAAEALARLGELSALGGPDDGHLVDEFQAILQAS